MPQIGHVKVSCIRDMCLFLYNVSNDLTPLFSLILLVSRLLRAVLSVKEEFYHRHVVTYNLFAPVFDLYRVEATGVGNNLITSSILEVSFYRLRLYGGH